MTTINYQLDSWGHPLERKHSRDAGWDVRSGEHTTVHPGERAVIGTGIHLDIPAGWYAEVKPRSGLAVRNGIDTLAGVIDSGYLGEVKIVLLNTGNDDFNVDAGDRIAQIIFNKYENVEFVDCPLSTVTDRGNNGFGSTGVK